VHRRLGPIYKVGMTGCVRRRALAITRQLGLPVEIIWCTAVRDDEAAHLERALRMLVGKYAVDPREVVGMTEWVVADARQMALLAVVHSGTDLRSAVKGGLHNPFGEESNEALSF
jgi:hypothetical protein